VEVEIRFAYAGTAPADESFYVTEIQLETGTVATPFEHRFVGTELALCHRYYYQVPIAPNSFVTVGQAYGTGIAYFGINWPVTMRVAPAIAGGGGALLRLGAEVVSAPSAANSSVSAGGFSVVWSATPFVDGAAVYLYQAPSVTLPVIIASAEL
jgi:hypothetical protein